MGRQSAEMGRSRSPLGDRSGPSGQPQRSAGLETTGCKGPSAAAHAEGGRRGEACAATRWANLRCTVSCQGAAGRAQPTGLSWVRGDWRCGRAGGRLPIDRKIGRQASGSPASAGRRSQRGLVERTGTGRPSVKHWGCGARPEARAKEVAGSDRWMTGELGRLRAGRAAWRYLVDPASSHMLVSKIKPCMSKYKLLYTVKLRMAH